MLIKPCNFNIYLETLKFMYHALKISNCNKYLILQVRKKEKKSFTTLEVLKLRKRAKFWVCTVTEYLIYSWRIALNGN